MSTGAPSDGLTAEQYIAQGRFRSVCPVGGASYCDIGPAEPTDVFVMACGSGMDSVLTGVCFDGFCTDNGIRLICVDKPGMGQTPPCPLADRVTTHTVNTANVLAHLNVHPKALISISSGFIYALHFLAHKSALFEGRPPALFALSPWISFDDAPSLGYTSFAPNWLVSAVPPVISAFTSPRLMASFAWSTGVSNAVSTAAKSIGPVSAGPILPTQSGAAAPLQSLPLPSKDRLHLAMHGAISAPGVSDEFLLCLGRGPAGFWGYKDYPEVFDRIARATASGTTQRARLRLFMGDRDGLVPRKAQERFVALFTDAPGSSSSFTSAASWDFDQRTFPGDGHDDIVRYVCCWEDIAAYARTTTN